MTHFLKALGQYIANIRFKVWLEWYKLVCKYWSWRLPNDLDGQLEVWREIDHRKDKSYTGRNFRAWLYMRKIDSHHFKKIYDKNT